MQIVRAVRTCPACPSQWDAWTTDGQYLYLRYRHGIGSVEQHPSPDLDTWGPEYAPLAEWDDGTGNGEISLTEFLATSGLTLAPGATVEGEPQGG
ncbi:hypothetical protein GCM10010275_30070 [Streptomyces litmocidini]|uniref:hypothetical protein n=1 Tax=Streptomyces litmocidini TaxID=67318 RepID=UPI00167C8D33|nr:hypothetical protein [Streptomyces litmocidini]GGU91028.1 hypothetical protein GCM10010275_30070 [Streptomyces litmocidini]